MKMTRLLSFAAILLCAAAVAHAESDVVWNVGAPVLRPGAAGTFDETAVKDPTVVFYGGKWHVIYTARGQGHYTIGHVAAPTLEGLQDAPRHCIRQLGTEEKPYAAAPQVFFFEPTKTWYLIYQTFTDLYQPTFATTKTIEDPASWSGPKSLVKKFEKDKWIDFWVLCDDTTAYLFYTRRHHDVMVMTTPIEQFPGGFANPKVAFAPVHEAVHIYKVKGRKEYHMFYERRAEDKVRRFGLATASSPAGPYTITDDNYAIGSQFRYPEGAERWTDEVSHGELLRTGYDQLLEYDPAHTRFLIQGLRTKNHTGDYAELSWTLGVIERAKKK